ncbi:DUF4366 domain-containing protein [Streptococcus suis]|nr:DUF4366 domain-containing protein [Streptococcus suis]
MLFNRQIVFAQGSLIPTLISPTEVLTQTKVEVKIKYIFKDESVYKEEIIEAETGQVLDSGDLPMLEDNMKFIDEFLFYKVKGDGTDEIIRKVEKITVKDKETQTDDEIKEQVNEEKPTTDTTKTDKETQTENATKDNSTQTDITKNDLDKMDREYQELKDKIDGLNKELKDKDRLSDKQKEKIKDIEDDIGRLENKLKKDKEKVSSSKENSELRKLVEDLEKEGKELKGRLDELNKKKANAITNESISPGNSSEGILKSITPSAFASTKEQEKLPQSSNIKSSAPSMANTEKKNTEDKEKEVRYPNKLTTKQVPNNNQNSDADSLGEQINTNKGVDSAPSKARASVVENKDNANQDYPIHHNDDKDKKETDKYSADARQFVTFQTKSGKTFHLIINHDEQSENVMLLTEVSEDDLLNMVEKKEKPKEEVKKIEETVPESEVKKEEPKKEEGKGNGSYIFLGIIVLAVVGAGYYFKIYKKKQEDDDYDEDEEEYDEFEDEYEREDDAEGLEEKEQQTIDDMAIDSYDDEEEEE